MKALKSLEITSFSLHLIAMTCMLLDHMWATIIPGNMWMYYIGRLAFPIFAFLLVEGYFHTKDLKKYMQRLFIVALLSEIPFNLMNSGSIIAPFHQNVLWTFLIGLVCLKKIDNKKFSPSTLFTCIISILIATICMCDYGGFGIMTILVFYFFRKKKLLQLVGLYLINFVFIQNMDIPILNFFFPVQGFALFSLLFIWLYKGKQGVHSPWIQWMNYLFYPIHILILSLIAI